MADPVSSFINLSVFLFDFHLYLYLYLPPRTICTLLWIFVFVFVFVDTLQNMCIPEEEKTETKVGYFVGVACEM